MTVVKPLLLGYQKERLTTPNVDAEAARDRLRLYAEDEGYALGEIFIDRDPNAPGSALLALIEAAKKSGAAAVAVTRVEDLGLVGRVQKLTKNQIEREAGVPVHVLSS